jgi:hypothetical protein
MSSERMLVALSAGGTEKELSQVGMSLDKVEELMVQMSVQLLADGCRLGFGGTLGTPAQSLTKHLIDVATSGRQQVDLNARATWPVINYSAWPYHQAITDEQKADLAGVCEFRPIDPPGVSNDVLADALTSPQKEAQKSVLTAKALSTMREIMTAEAHLRIVWAGRISGAAGWIPGILEEVTLTLKHRKPLLICGGFGGCARLIADFLADDDSAWPREFTLQGIEDADPSQWSSDDRNQVELRLTEAESQLRQYRKALHTEESLSGVPVSLASQCLTEQSPASFVKLVSTVAHGLSGK